MVAANVFSILGNMASGFLYLSPLRTIMCMVKKKSIEGFSSVPYIFTALSCALWVLYGCVHPHSNLFLPIISTIGLGLQIFYIAVFYRYAPVGERVWVWSWLLGAITTFIVIVSITLLYLRGSKERLDVVGKVIHGLNILMYVRSYATMVRVVRNKSWKLMPFLPLLTGLWSSVCWAIYAVTQFDILGLVSNIFGAVTSLLQLVAYTIYRWYIPAIAEQADHPMDEPDLEDGVAGIMDGPADTVDVMDGPDPEDRLSVTVDGSADRASDTIYELDPEDRAADTEFADLATNITDGLDTKDTLDGQADRVDTLGSRSLDGLADVTNTFDGRADRVAHTLDGLDPKDKLTAAISEKALGHKNTTTKTEEESSIKECLKVDNNIEDMQKDGSNAV